MIGRILPAFALVLVLARPAPSEAQEIADGRVTMAIEPAPLEDVLGEIAAAAGIELKVRGDLGEVAAQQLDDVPLESVIRRLAGPHPLVMLHEPDGDVRAVRIYAASGDPQERREELAERARAVKAIRREAAARPTGEDDRSARLQTIRELARQGGPEALAELGRVLSEDEDPALRRLAAGALAGIGGDAAVDDLGEALGDDDSSVRLQALRGLYGVLRDDAAPYLEQVVRTETDPGLRLMALEMARDLPESEAGPVFQEALDDEDPDVRAAAEDGLGR